MTHSIRNEKISQTKIQERKAIRLAKTVEVMLRRAYSLREIEEEQPYQRTPSDPVQHTCLEVD